VVVTPVVMSPPAPPDVVESPVVELVSLPVVTPVVV
jgi:hypothetical protein